MTTSDGSAVDAATESTAPDPSPKPAPRRAPLTVGHGVIVEMVRLAALEVPGVLRVSRAGPLHRLNGSPVKVEVRDGGVNVRVYLIARPGHELTTLSAQVRSAIAATARRLLGLEPREVTVVIDGVESYGQ